MRAVRPPGWAVTVAPAIGSPSLASVTTPWTRPLGTGSMRYADRAVRIASPKPSCRASLPVAFSMPTSALRPSPGLAGESP